MTGDHNEVAAALAAGTAALIGRYTYDTSGWTWTDALFAIHGFVAGEVVPSSELLIAHQDPTDVAEARETFKQALSSGEPFASYHHLIDAHQRRRTVLVAGRGRVEDGQVVELHGYVVDLTDASRSDRQSEVTAALAGIAEHRAVIEQVKGVLMLAFGISADEAFEVLRTQSQDHNVKLNELAGRIVEAVESPSGEPLAEDGTKERVLAALDVLVAS